jgi:hypothetical protein
MAASESIDFPQLIQKIELQKNYLAKTVQDYANPIIKRWKKMSYDTRQTIITSKCPDLQEIPYAIVYMDTLPSEPTVSCRLPWLGYDCLARESDLLWRLVHIRTSSPIQQWIQHDLDQINSVKKINPRLFSLPLSQIPTVSDEYCDWGKCSPIDAMHIARAQFLLFELLVAIVDEIYPQTMRKDTGKPEKWDMFVNSNFGVQGVSLGWSAIGKQSYIAPFDFDIPAMMRLGRAQLDNAEDEVWFLQTDPGFYSRRLRAFQHLRETPSSMGNYVCENSMKRWLKWIYIYEEMAHVEMVYKKFQEKPVDFRMELERAVRCLKWLLVYTWLAMQKAFWDDLVRSQSFKSYHHAGGVSFEGATHLHCCLIGLSGNKPDNSRTEVSNTMIYFQQLDDLLVGDAARPQKHLDQRVVEGIADLAAIYELAARVRSSSVSEGKIDHDDIVAGKNREYWRHYLLKSQNPDLIKEADLESSRAIGPFVERFINLPRTGRANQGGSGERRSALIDIWKQYARHRLAVFQGSYRYSDGDLEIERARLYKYLTSEITQPPAPCVPDQYLESSRLKTVDELCIIESGSTKKVLTVESGVGKKAGKRNKSDIVRSSPVAVALETGEQVDDTPRITVPIQTYEILIRLWPKDGKTFGQTKWEDFTLALTKMGFAIQPKRGSVFSFERGGKSILFHRPHPSHELDRDLMKENGKRLAKNYGFNREMFIVP